MKKTIHLKNLIALSIFLYFLLSLVLPIFSATPTTVCAPLTAQAEEKVDVSKLQRWDENYEWVNGASIGRNDSAPDEFRYIKFRFEITNPDIFHLNATKKGGGDDRATYEFTIYRESTQGATPIYQIGILSTYGSFFVGHKRVAFENVESDSTFRPGEISFLPDMSKSDKARVILSAETVATANKESKQLYEAAKTVLKDEIGYTLDYAVLGDNASEPFFAAEQDGVPYLDIILTVNSPTTEYFVTAKSQIRWYEKTVEVKEDTFLSSITGSLVSWMFKKTVQKEIYTGEEYDSLIKSPTRSVKGVLENMQAAGMLETEITSETARVQALNIINNTTNEIVNVSYLQQIGNTPFAKKVTKKVTVPVVSGKIYYDDVSAALGGESLNCLGASVNGFVRDSYGDYTAEYLSSTRVEAKTVDGNRTDYFLKLGKTFRGFYSEIESEGAFNDGVYENMLNKIKQTYPAVTNYTDTTLYGLWGYVVVPETTTLHSLFKDIFQTPTEWSGSLFDYSIKGNLSVDTYTALLNEHGYSWLETIWQTVFTGVTNGFSLPATHYLFCADPKKPEVNIGENGGELGDESGVIVEKLEEVTKVAIESTNKATEEAFRTVRMLIATVLIIAAGFAITYGIIRLKKYSNG